MVVLIVNQILKMLIILLAGFLCFKRNIVNQQGNSTMANLLLMVVNPLVAIMSLQIEYEPERLRGLITAYLMAIAAHGIAIAVSQLLIRRHGNREYSIERFTCVYSNCGFIGIPLIQSVLGSEGVFYLTAYITTFNILSWTHGVTLMTGDFSLKNLKRGLMSPMIFASVIGLILFTLQIRIPDVPADALNYIADMNTPLAMLIAGFSVAQTDLAQLLKKPRIYMISLLKLLLVPSLVLILLMLIPLQREVALTILIASACPAAASCTAFSLRFKKNYRYASELYAFTTLASLVTVPLFVFAAEIFLL